MSSLAAGARSERTNRWLLIGAAILAIITGIIVFAVLANSDSGDSGSKTTTGAEKKVLVANRAIPANTKLTADMFDVKTLPSGSLVDHAVSDPAALAGQTARTDILKNEQLSTARLGISSKTDTQLAYIVTPGMRGKSIPVSAPDIVAGLIVPNDHVDIIVTYHQSAGAGGGDTITRVETVLSNVRVLALAQTTVDAQPVLDSNGTPIAGENGQIGERPEDVKANPTAGTITLELSPRDVQVLAAADDKGKLSLSLRNPSDTAPVEIPPVLQNDQGRINP